MATKNTTFLIGLAAAAAAGAVLGLLMAPKKGADLRQDISDKVDDLSDRVKQLTHRAKRRMDHLQDELQDMHPHAQVKASV
jgi:gas vesicle protein